MYLQLSAVLSVSECARSVIIASINLMSRSYTEICNGGTWQAVVSKLRLSYLQTKEDSRFLPTFDIQP